MDDVEQSHSSIIEALASQPGRVFVLGGVDTGKTTFTRRLARAGLESGQSVALVDADVGQSTLGAPGTVGLKIVREAADLEPPVVPDAMSFVGSMSPRGH